MPRGDRTGPEGRGPMTGRRAGYCGGFQDPGYLNSAPGAGRGRGWGGYAGRGRGWRHWFHATGLPGWARFGATPAPVQEQATASEEIALEHQLDVLQRQLNMVSNRLQELGKTKGAV